jgi:hypothetical protein
VATDIWKHRALQVFVFEVDRTPRFFDTVPRQIVPKRVWIVEAISRELVKRRIGIGQSFFIGRNRERTFPNSHLCVDGDGAYDQTYSGDQLQSSHMDSQRRLSPSLYDSLC